MKNVKNKLNTLLKYFLYCGVGNWQILNYFDEIFENYQSNF